MPAPYPLVAWGAMGAFALLAPLAMAAQKAPPSRPAATRQAQTAQPAARGPQPSSADSADAQAKAAILASPRWQNVERAFYEWLSVQRLYPKDQVPRLKAQFNQMVRSMNADQLQAWLAEMEQKVNILMSPEAQDVRDWLGYYVSAKAVLPESELKKIDVLNMTAAQLHEVLDDAEQRRASRRSESQAFNLTRQQQVRQAVREQEQREKQEAALYTTNRNIQNFYPGMQSPANQSYYAPRRQPAMANQGPRMWVGPWGGVGFALP
jgi:aromatic ring-cleaving dioxygenase